MSIYTRRLIKLKTLLQKENKNSALLIGSAPQVILSRDVYHPYRQDSNFYYMTGSQAKEVLLLIFGDKKKPILFSKPLNKSQAMWDGPGERLGPLVESLKGDLVVTKDLEKEVLAKLKGVCSLYFQSDSRSTVWNLAQLFLKNSSSPISPLPSSFIQADSIFEKLRLYKEPEEIKLIQQAAKLTNLALSEVVPLIGPKRTEAEIAHCIDFNFKLHGGSPAFSTIVASGRSAATLHHEPTSKHLGKGEMLLIDCGMAHNMYCSDVTRVFPVSGAFNSIQDELYHIVLEAQESAIKKVRHGVKIQEVFNAAAKILTLGLVDLKILRGKNSELMKRKAYRPFFPHGIGHSLGLDVHDIGNLRGNTESILESGMVFTIEPGLYFSKKTKKIPACGIRIEDDVLVTKKGCEVITGEIPKIPAPF